MIKDLINSFDLQTISTQLILIVISILVGIIIGAEREYRNKSAGLRTFILISFGSCVFTILSIKIGIQNPDRLAANIVTGIGFLGAGVIFKDDTKIGGITTASAIWGTASLGMAAGSGHIYLALLGTVVVMAILRLLLPLQRYIDTHHKIREYKIVTQSYTDFELCIEVFKKYNLDYALLRETKEVNHFSRTWVVTGSLQKHERLTNNLINNPKIISYQF
ncbi:MgtC/SapB family protein [Niabella soli]|uniref:MgtC/SapB family protein n=1 Tax=Niabella soli TaxID=446683 RepID=UPI0002499870|nr:MgtC/SapB family protein [Niabella soli]